MGIAMPEDPTEMLVRDVLVSGLLEPLRADSFRSWVEADKPDGKAVVGALLNQFGLTHFQVREFVKGRGKELVLGPYHLIELLGEGGMGRVFRARHTRLGRDVALKLIRKEKLDHPQTIARFRQEVRAAAQLVHPNVVHAFDADESNGNHFYTMEYVDGDDLTKLVRDRGPLPLETACEVIRQASLGLQHAYEKGLVHRDIKPSNILLAKDGKAKITDLGLAILTDPEDDKESLRVTQVGFVLGTPDFVAPEQARDSMNVDTRADIYSLAATLFYVLTAKVPYDAPSPAEKLVMHVKAPVPSVLDHRPELPHALDAIIRRAMAKHPDDRPQTPIEFATALEPFCASRSTPIGMVELADSFHPTYSLPQVRRVPVAALVVVGVTALFLCAVGVWFWNVLHPPVVTLNAEHVNRIGMTLVQLPAGSFPMGSPDDELGRESHEGPVRDVTISTTFFVGNTEVTDKQFRDVMGTSPSRTAMKARTPDQHPVDSVTWLEAVEFCKKLTQRDREQLPRGWEYRLPTEAEWEYACRAGTTGPYSFGTTIEPLKQAMFTLDGSKKPIMTQPVATAEANPFGLQDLHGNVWEWTADYYQRNRGSEAVTDPTGPKSGDFRVIRGGGWDSPAAMCRSAARDRMMPGERRGNVGFRVVLAPIRAN